MKTWAVCILISLMVVPSAWAQPDTVWTRHYGGSQEEICRALTKTADGGYALFGQTMTFAVGGRDYWLVKTDSVGNELWNHAYGGTGQEFGYAIITTADSGLVLAGASNSFSGSYDAWIIRTDAQGDTLWTRALGTTVRDECYAIVETPDNGLVGAGYTTAAGSGNFWLFKLNANGDSLWSRNYGGGGLDICWSLVMTPDSGFLLAGQTQSYGLGYANAPNYWILRTNANGDSLWSRVFDGTGVDVCKAAALMPDSGFVLGGYSQSHSAGNEDGWIIRTDSHGDSLWMRNFGTGRSDYCNAVGVDRLGNIIAGGWASTSAGYDNFWLFSTDRDGNLRWDRTLGGQSPDECHAILVESDSMFVMAGESYSYSYGLQDFWLVKTRAREPMIQVVPTSVDFEPVQVGGSGAQTVSILNPGDVNVTVTGITVPPRFAVDLVPPFSVSPGAEQIMTVVFVPDSVGPFGGTLILHSNATSGDSMVVLSGVGVPEQQTPVIDVQPDLVDFGEVRIGNVGLAYITVNNIGLVNLRVDSISVPDGYSTDFSVPVTITPNHGRQITVFFRPQNLINYNGLLIAHSSASHGDSTIELMGTGALAAADLAGLLPTDYDLGVFPNPFNAQAVIAYALPRTEAAEINLFDVTGRLIRRLFTETVPAGEYRLSFDGGDLPAGIYFVALQTPSYQSTHKLILLK